MNHGLDFQILMCAAVHAQIHMPGFENLILNTQQVSEQCGRPKENFNVQLKISKNWDLRGARHQALAEVKGVTGNWHLLDFMSLCS